jgi:uncharacterized protein
MDRASLADLFAADPFLATLLAEARERDGEAAQRDLTHDVAHGLRVAHWTLQLGGADVDPREAVAAALLHDAVNLPKDSPERALASTKSAEYARTRLSGEFTPEAIDRIADAIRDHSFSRGAVPATPLGRALQDADRLEALGAIGLLRCVSTGVRMQGEWFHGEDPWATSRELDDSRYSVDHFYKKLLKLPATMRTEAGRAEAERRAAFLRAFLVQLGVELGNPAPEA